ncbi:MAG TPA: hypothetical protein VFN97_14625 [Actinospica sp.]|nr:hypothetical protein [Actinospica sp.]
MMTTSQRGVRWAGSAVVLASFGAVCASSAGPVRQIAGLTLIGTLACALWLPGRASLAAIVPAIGLTVVFLILAGLALAAAHGLSAVLVALTTAVATLAALWVGPRPPTDVPDARNIWLNPTKLLALAGALVFAAAAVLAVRGSAASASDDADQASSVAIWAYPSGDQLRVGVEQPAGHGAATLRIVVTQAGATIAVWNDVRLAPGGTWQAPALTMSGKGPAQVTALRGGTIVASLSSR